MELRDSSRPGRPLVICAVVLCCLQVALAPQISILGGRINFMVVLAAVLAMSGNAERAVVGGFLCGLFYDLTASVPVGLMTLILTVASFVLANTQVASVGGGVDGWRSAGVFSVAVCLVYGLALLIMGEQSDIVYALFGHGLTSGILTAVVSIPFMAVARNADGAHRGFTVKGKGSRFKGLR